MERTKSIAMKAQARRHHLFLEEQKSFFAHRKTKKKDRFHLIPSNSGVEDSTLTHDPHSAPPSPAEGDALWWCLLDSTGTCRSLLLPIPLCGNRVLSSPHHRPLVRVAVHTLSIRIEDAPRRIDLLPRFPSVISELSSVTLALASTAVSGDTPHIFFAMTLPGATGSLSKSAQGSMGRSPVLGQKKRDEWSCSFPESVVDASIPSSVQKQPPLMSSRLHNALIMLMVDR